MGWTSTSGRADRPSRVALILQRAVALPALAAVMLISACGGYNVSDVRAAQDLCEDVAAAQGGGTGSAHTRTSDPYIGDGAVAIAGWWDVSGGAIDVSDSGEAVQWRAGKSYSWQCTVASGRVTAFEFVTALEPVANAEKEGDSGGVGPDPVSESESCRIKGNISIDTGEKIYHVPGQEYYDETRINEAYGERWFCTEQEAINAGWRKARV